MRLKLGERQRLRIYMYHTRSFKRYFMGVYVGKGIYVDLLFQRFLARIALKQKNAFCLILTQSVIQSLRTRVFVQPTTWKYLQFARVSI